MKKRLLCLVLAALMIVPMLLLPASAAQTGVQKKIPSRAIAIVFDNSGSMYSTIPKAWCRATYAMEVFASMMNDGDKLLIYPMHAITVDGQKIEANTPLTINGPGDANIIRNIYTPTAGGTPFETVVKAREGLESVQADEKYLIVLTDGTEFSGYGIGRNEVKLGEELDKLTNNGVFVMYLGIGEEGKTIPIEPAQKPQYSSSQYYKCVKNSGEVVNVLADMCNRIFGRNTLPQKYINGEKISFDVSMSKVILFVQGKDITDVKLDRGTKVSERDVHYGTEGSGGGGPVDDTLQGMIVTYENLEAGEYTLSYSGNWEQTVVYYEPDVNLNVVFSNADGVFDPAKDPPYEGEYTMECQLVDRNGAVTNSELLGSPKYTITCIKNGTPEEPVTTNSLNVPLVAGTTFAAEFKVEYLDGYSITVDSDMLGWGENGAFEIKTRPAGDFKMQISGGKDTYSLSTLEEDAVYNITFTFDGEKLSGEQLNDLEFVEPALQGGNAKVIAEKTEDGYTVSLKYNGDAGSTALGKQTLVFSASYQPSGAEPSKTGDVKKTFTIEDDSEGIDAELVLKQTFYEISKLDEGEPIIINVTVGGQPMTAEEFAKTTLEFDAGGVPYEEPERDAANSRYVVKLKEDSKLEGGKYTVTCRVNGLDSVGREVSAEAKGQIECQTYPIWVPWLIGIGIALLIALLIYLYLNAKVLPNQIMTGDGNFMVDGDRVPGAFECTYSGKGSKTGSLSVRSPKCMTNPRAKCGFNLELEAISPRYTRSSARRVRVIGLSPTNPSATMSIQVGATRYTRDPVTNKLVKAGGKPDAPVDFNIGNNAKAVVTAEIMDMNDGSSISCSINVPLKFY